MFSTAAHHIADNAGSKTLHPVLDLNSANRFKPYCILRRKKSFWFWKKPKIYPTQLTLDDLFLQKINFPTTKYTFIEKFTDSPSFIANGKISADIASELDLSLSGSDEIHLTISLGDIMKSEGDWQLTQECLQKNVINTSHRLFSEMRKSKRSTLCVVLECISTKADGDLSESKDFKIATDDSVAIPLSKVQVVVKPKGSVESKVTKSFSIPADTVLCFSCNEISIDSSGIATLHTAVDRLDDSGDPLFLGSKKPADPVLAIKAEFKPLLRSSKLTEIQKVARALLKDVSDETLQAIHLLFSSAEMSLEHKSEETSIPVAVLEHLFNGDECDGAVRDLMLILGFLIPEDVDDSHAEVRFPNNDDENLLKMCLGLIDAMLDIAMATRKLLSGISTTHMRILNIVIDDQIHGRDTSRKQADMSEMSSSDPSTLAFLKDIGIVEMLADADEFLTYAEKDKSKLLDVFTVLYVLSNVDA